MKTMHKFLKSLGIKPRLLCLRDVSLEEISNPLTPSSMEAIHKVLRVINGKSVEHLLNRHEFKKLGFLFPITPNTPELSHTGPLTTTDPLEVFNLHYNIPPAFLEENPRRVAGLLLACQYLIKHIESHGDLHDRT